jgi:hypothetical protein
MDIYDLAWGEHIPRDFRRSALSIYESISARMG